MQGRLERFVLKAASRRPQKPEPSPLLVELLCKPEEAGRISYEAYPFYYTLTEKDGFHKYDVWTEFTRAQVSALRQAVAEASKSLDPREVEPLTFGRLVEVMSQLAAEHLDGALAGSKVKELAELIAYEAIGLSRVLALAKDEKVTEFFADSETSPVYLDHAQVGRCETTLTLTARERGALETHLDTFRGYTLDYLSPSLKNDLEVSGARLRVSLDLEPLAVNRFALDVRRLNVSALTMEELIAFNMVSDQAAAFLVGWIEAGGNCTIVGETGTGKTTLLNALDEKIEPKLRRLYIEDAVETRDLLSRGYHQVKVKVDPFERGAVSGRTKEMEIVKALHRSPDIVILSEIQSEEHSRAFFHALAAGARGIQTFHASSVEQAIGRWVNMHNVAEESLADLGVLVQMVRPDKLMPARFVQRVCVVASEGGAPRVRELFLRDREFRLRDVAGTGRLNPPMGMDPVVFSSKVARASARIGGSRLDVT
jgi:type IV secretory pathway ATPase VirB11/archaellum biosynthesis ATPase